MKSIGVDVSKFQAKNIDDTVDTVCKSIGNRPTTDTDTVNLNFGTMQRQQLFLQLNVIFLPSDNRLSTMFMREEFQSEIWHETCNETLLKSHTQAHLLLLVHGNAVWRTAGRYISYTLHFLFCDINM